MSLYTSAYSETQPRSIEDNAQGPLFLSLFAVMIGAIVIATSPLVLATQSGPDMAALKTAWSGSQKSVGHSGWIDNKIRLTISKQEGIEPSPKMLPLAFHLLL